MLNSLPVTLTKVGEGEIGAIEETQPVVVILEIKAVQMPRRLLIDEAERTAVIALTQPVKQGFGEGQPKAVIGILFKFDDPEDQVGSDNSSWLYSCLKWHHTPEWLRSCCMSKAWKVSEGHLEAQVEKKKKTLGKRTEKIAKKEKSKDRYKKNKLFMGTLFLVSIFYAVTVLQTAYEAQKNQYETGNNDICFFNARCQNPLMYSAAFLDFNHFYSNIGYVMLGITFNLIVFLKSRVYQKYEKKLEETEKKRRHTSCLLYTSPSPRD